MLFDRRGSKFLISTFEKLRIRQLRRVCLLVTISFNFYENLRVLRFFRPLEQIVRRVRHFQYL